MRHFLRDDDVTPLEQRQILWLASQLAVDPRFASGILSGSSVGLFFQKPSLRTRVSSEVACARLGAYPVQLRAEDLHLQRGETIADTAQTLGGFLSLILARVFDHEVLEELAGQNALPVVNGLSSFCHPLQALADLLTLSQEWNGDFRSRRIAYLGDGNNVANSLVLACGMAGLSITVASPKGYAPAPVMVERARHFARSSGAEILVTENPIAAATAADAVYTDVWTSMGSEGEEEIRRGIFQPYQVNERIMSVASDNAVVLHCLPAHRGEEIVDDVLDGPRSRVLQQAANRLPTVAAFFLFLLAPQFVRSVLGVNQDDLQNQEVVVRSGEP